MSVVSSTAPPRVLRYGGALMPMSAPSNPRRSRIRCISVCGRWGYVPRSLPDGLRLHRWQPERLVDPGQDRGVVGSDAAHEVDSRCTQLTDDHDKR